MTELKNCYFLIMSEKSENKFLNLEADLTIQATGEKKVYPTILTVSICALLEQYGF